MTEDEHIMLATDGFGLPESAPYRVRALATLVLLSNDFLADSALSIQRVLEDYMYTWGRKYDYYVGALHYHVSTDEYIPERPGYVAYVLKWRAVSMRVRLDQLPDDWARRAHIIPTPVLA